MSAADFENVNNQLTFEMKTISAISFTKIFQIPTSHLEQSVKPLGSKIKSGFQIFRCDNEICKTSNPLLSVPTGHIF